MKQPGGRWVAIDWMRGLVMVLMALDHSSMFYNGHRFAADAALFYKGAAIPAAQFWLRWVTHLCAPTFAFLAGVALALSAAKRADRGEDPRRFTRHLWIRGGLLIGLDWLVFSALGPKRLFFQVLFALGAGMLAISFLRRLSHVGLLALALGWIALGEAIVSPLWTPAQGNAPLWLAPFVGVHLSSWAFVLYPWIPWLAIMLLGWALGVEMLRREPADIAGLLLRWGLGALAVFALVRGLNGYGNMSLLRSDGSLLQWFFVSKYPPSLSFVALELGILALLLAAALSLSRFSWFGHRHGPMVVFGQTALFFYLVHFGVLAASAGLLGPGRKAGIGRTFLVALALLALLYPLCQGYRRFKSRRPHSFVRFI